MAECTRNCKSEVEYVREININMGWICPRVFTYKGRNARSVQFQRTDCSRFALKLGGQNARDLSIITGGIYLPLVFTSKMDNARDV